VPANAPFAAVVGVLADVFVGQVGAEDGGLRRARRQVDFQLHAALVGWKADCRLEDAVGRNGAGVQLGTLQMRRQLLLRRRIEPEGAAFEDGDAAEGDARIGQRNLGRVNADVFADGHDDATDVRVVAGERAFHQWRIDDRLAKRARQAFGRRAFHGRAHHVADAFAIADHVLGQVGADSAQRLRKRFLVGAGYRA